MIKTQETAMKFGFLNQIERDRQAREETQEIDVIIRVKIRGTNSRYARQMISNILNKDHMRDILGVEIIEGVVDKAQLEDAQRYIETLEADVGTGYIPSVTYEDEIEPVIYWTRKQMAKYHDVSCATIGRWLDRKPIEEESFNGGQYQIPADLARSYQPLKFKTGRKRKDD